MLLIKSTMFQQAVEKPASRLRLVNMIPFELHVEGTDMRGLDQQNGSLFSYVNLARIMHRG